jgi:hypothetical protein
MDADASEASIAPAAFPWLHRLVFGLDGWLRHWNSVVEYSSDPRCIFRIQLGQLERDLMLADGARGSAASRVIDLHLWNEHMPVMPPCGASIGWARLALDCVQTSLEELASYLSARPELDDISIIRGNVTCGVPSQRAQVVRLCERYGFEVVAASSTVTTVERVHRLGENMLASLMILARNGYAVRSDTLRRDRVQVFLSRGVLLRRFGARGGI